MMTPHFLKAFETLKRRVISIATIAEEQLQQAIQALLERDVALAEKVVARDREIDMMEVDLEEECLKALALFQPVAMDLRFIVSLLKINNDLERIGDLASNIAERCLTLEQWDDTEYPYDVLSMSELAREAVRLSIDALVNSDVALARKVIEQDIIINKRHRAHYSDVRDRIKKDPERVGFYLEFLSFSRYLERIGDLATNIAEDVIYLVEGKIVRHAGKLHMNITH